jgi:hypothetical protein
MNKIASPQELQAELQSILAFAHGHGPEGKPERQVVAARLRALADRVAASRQLPVSDLLKPMESNGVVFFDIDGDSMSLAVRKGEVPAEVMGGWIRKHLPDGKMEPSPSGKFTLHFKSWTGKPVTVTTQVTLERRK